MSDALRKYKNRRSIALMLRWLIRLCSAGTIFLSIAVLVTFYMKHELAELMGMILAVDVLILILFDLMFQMMWNSTAYWERRATSG